MKNSKSIVALIAVISVSSCLANPYNPQTNEEIANAIHELKSDMNRNESMRLQQEGFNAWNSQKHRWVNKDPRDNLDHADDDFDNDINNRNYRDRDQW
jgi:hypothetical protein